ncbi:MAG: metallophosphoesterase [Flavobacteriales bacterium]|nr:MAG: metallophosphoesterase [Flavobacteriales bacterium]
MLNRRSFIIKFLSSVFGLIFLDAFWFEKYIIRWNQFDISDDDIEKIKLIQISDLHLTEIKSFHTSLAERINSERPDVLLITGDAITRNHRIELLNSFLDLIDIKIPIKAILGNKEYAGRVDLDILRTVYEAHNGILLVNEADILQKENRRINIVGIDDFVCGVPNVTKAIQNIDKDLDTVFLNHCPIYREEIDRLSMMANLKPKLILAGHTHGGQITFFGIPIFKPFGAGRYLRGWYQDDGSNMYVSNGIGTAVLPIRFGARASAEIFYI